MTHAREQTYRPDSKGRITLGKLAEGISSFRLIEQNGDKLVFEAMKEVPAREAWLYKNPEALKAVLEGLADVKAGRVYDLGDFTQYADDDGEAAA